MTEHGSLESECYWLSAAFACNVSQLRVEMRTKASTMIDRATAAARIKAARLVRGETEANDDSTCTIPTSSGRVARP
eukprot:2888249-Pleurochrysis_carterae.AAC.2